MTDQDIVLQKGQSIKFLDYTIKNSLNNDGLVLFKENGKGYETHLGNFGEGKPKNIDYCKLTALLYFMIARPEHFAHSLVYKVLRGSNSGSTHEYYGLKNVCKNEGIEFPEEITCGESGIIEFNNKPIKA